MTKAALLAVFAISSFAPLLAQEVPSAPAESDATPSENGTIVLYRRGTVVGLANACPVRYKGSELVELGRSKAFTWSVKPGRYILENKTSSVEVTVDPGETRYVRCAMKMGIFTYRADLQIADGTEYEELKHEFEAPGD